MDPTIKPNTDQPLAPWIPEGYVLVTGPDDQTYVMPEFCVPALIIYLMDTIRKMHCRYSRLQEVWVPTL